MFPLHTNPTILLAFLLLGTLVAVGVAWRGWPKLTRLALLAALTLGWPVAFPLMGGGHPDLILGALWLMMCSAGALTAGLALGWAVRRVPPRVPPVALAILPALLTTAALLERQRVPNAPCAQQASFDVGGVTVSVPRDGTTMSKPADGAPPQPWTGTYSDYSGAKADVRRLCRIDPTGTEPLPVTHLWLTAHDVGRALDRACEAGTASPNLCAARAEDGPTGQDCRPSQAADGALYCTLWLDAAPGVTVIASAWHAPDATGGTAAGDAAQLLPLLFDGTDAQD